MQCPNCKNEVTAGEPFCDYCGQNLHDLQPVRDPVAAQTSDSVPPVQSLPPLEEMPPAHQVPAAKLAIAKLIIKDDHASYDLSIGCELVVGRTDPIDGIYPDIDLTAHDTATGVSRRHASLHEQGGQWFVKDLNSTNYTVVNRQRVNPDQEFLLSDGDEIRFGRVVTIFRCA